MEKKVLIAVDGSRSSEMALDYLGLMEGAVIRDLHVTLLHIMNPIPAFMRKEGQRDPATYRRVQAMEKKYWQTAQDIFGQATERLQRHGMPAEHIEAKALPRSSGNARDILFEAEQGIYDAVVLGRRGINKAQEMFLGSVTNKVVQHAQRLPVWIVGGRVSSLKVLCAVDGSEGALKAVDHMAFMLGGNPECQVTLVHVGATLANYCPLDFEQDLSLEIEGDIMRGAQECMDDFYVRAVKVLREAGLDRDQIETKTLEGWVGVVKALMDEIKTGDYGTVVVGRRGENRSFFLGHVSDNLLTRSTDAALWVVG